MSKSNRDKKAHKARNPEKYFDGSSYNIHSGTPYEGINWIEVLFKEGIYPTKNTPQIAWSISGKRRRGSTRKSNQKKNK